MSRWPWTARRRATLLAGILAVAALGCAGDDAAGEQGAPSSAVTTDPGASTSVPVEPEPWEWEVVAPTEAGIDPEALEEARRYAFSEGSNTQGVVVVRGGAIVGEWYAEDADQDSWAASWSMAKSVTSALIGIALDEGDIPGIDEPMTTWYPQWADDGRADITLRHVLHMTSGLAWIEDYDPANVGASDVIQIVLTEDDPLAYVADRPLAHPPGTVFNYSSGNTLLLSGVLEQATGRPADEYAREKLFDPLDVDPVDWWRDVTGTTLTYCCLDMSSRDFARFGLLYLQDGRWDGEQVVPEAWVADSTTPAEVPDEEAPPYGYQWWLSGPDAPVEVFQAAGHDGQWIYVVPSLDLVVVRNGSYVKDPGQPVADPSLFVRYPPAGLVEGRGTLPPGEGWDPDELLSLVLASVTDG